MTQLSPQVIKLLGNLPDGTPVINLPGVREFLMKTETIERHHLGDKTVFVYRCPYGDDRTFTALNLAQITDWIVRHKVAHVKKSIRQKFPRQQRAAAQQVAPRRSPLALWGKWGGARG